jgi:holo-[acyl-carrier protein] synthase
VFEGMNGGPPALSTGVDLVELDRVRRLVERYGDRVLQRVYTPAEVEYSRGRVPELAVRFAAKEAVAKALGVGLRIMAQDGINFYDVETLPDERGKPLVHLHGRAAERARVLNLSRWSISLSHGRDVAIAFVVAVGAYGDGSHE